MFTIIILCFRGNSKNQFLEKTNFKLLNSLSEQLVNEILKKKEIVYETHTYS